MMVLYSSTVVFNWAFCSKTTSLSAFWDVELFESPLSALLFNFFLSTSLQLFRWLLDTLLAIGEFVVLLRLLLLTMCCLRFSNALSSHWAPSSLVADEVVSGKCCVNSSFTFVTSTLGWVWKKVWCECTGITTVAQRWVEVEWKFGRNCEELISRETKTMARTQNCRNDRRAALIDKSRPAVGALTMKLEWLADLVVELVCWADCNASTNFQFFVRKSCSWVNFGH